MISQDMMALGKKRSVIREIFEYGKIRSAEIGSENVFDFSLGNPNVPPPDCVKKALLDLLETEDSVTLHGYTSAQGLSLIHISNRIESAFIQRFTARLSAEMS